MIFYRQRDQIRDDKWIFSAAHIPLLHERSFRVPQVLTFKRLILEWEFIFLRVVLRFADFDLEAIYGDGLSHDRYILCVLPIKTEVLSLPLILVAILPIPAGVIFLFDFRPLIPPAPAPPIPILLNLGLNHAIGLLDILPQGRSHRSPLCHFLPIKSLLPPQSTLLSPTR